MPLRVVYLGSVWPEPESSAAGVRSRDLIALFRQQGWQVAFGSTSRENEFTARLAAQGVTTHSVAPNDPAFDDWIRGQAPDLVFFDRFMIEEQFGWRVAQAVPGAARVLDLVDLHSLRRARERVFRQTGRSDLLWHGAGAHAGKGAGSGAGAIGPELRGPDLYRELGAIFRSDLTLAISRPELALLGALGVPEQLLHYVPLLADAPGAGSPFDAAFAVPYSERAHFAAIGNFRHPPNADAFGWLKSELWPLIRARLPRAELHIYGAYPPRELMAATDREQGFRVRGPADQAVPTLARYRVNLAPLRFGAGLKGKIVDGWCAGTPAATTPVGAEGLADALASASPEYFGGIVADSAAGIAEAAVALYESEPTWQRARENGARIAASELHRQRHGRLLAACLGRLPGELTERRRDNLVGAMLGEHLGRSTEYFSRWIETKNRLAQALQSQD